MASAANDVVTKAYTDAHTLQPDKANDVTTAFRIKNDNQTFVSAAGGELGLYHADQQQGNLQTTGSSLAGGCGKQTDLIMEAQGLPVGDGM